MTSEVGRGTRWFVRGFLALFLACGLLSIEAWPFTGFNLYARRHHATRTGWQVVAVAGAREAAVQLQSLPVGYRKATKLLRPGPVDDAQHGTCVALADALAARDAHVSGIRIYYATYDVRTARRLHRELHDTCEPA
jgi:hypothetical protein